MKINTTTVLKNIDGKDYVEGERKLTLGYAIRSVLVVQKSRDALKQYHLTNELAHDEVDLSAEDVAFLKQVLKDHAASEPQRFYPHILGQAIDLLDPKPTKEDEKKA